jgi:DNA repair exonuclease SbcCD nuclease subunit
MELPERLDLYGPDGVPVLVTHGTPRRNNEGLYPELPDEKIAEIMEKEVKPQQLVICGHTHRPMLRRWQDMTIVNCGSVGYSLDGDTRACYAVAEWGGGEWQVQHRRVEYDRANVLKAIKKNASHTEAGPIMHFIHRIVETGLSVGMSSFVNSYLQLGDFPEPPEDVAHLESAVSRYFSERSRYS